MKLCAAACQILTFPEPDKSAEKVVEWMEMAAGEGVEVVAFPEACLCGYVCDQAYWEGAEPEAFARAEAQVIAAAGRLGIGVVLGTAHWVDGQLFNSLLAIDRDGAVKGRYAKTHFAENWPVPGRSLPVYKLGGVLAEYKLSAYRAMPIARATENGIFLVMANAPGNPRDLHAPSQSHGNSKIVHPDGNVLCEAGYFEERLVVAELDLEAATGAVARRAVEDETVLRAWMGEGVDLVEGELD